MKPPRPFFRHRLLLVIYSLAALLACSRLLQLQLWQQEALQKKGALASLQIRKEDAIRGLILDREGETLAISTPVSRLILNPMLILKNSEKKALQLAEKCQRKPSSHLDCTAVLQQEALYLQEKRLALLQPLAKALQESPEKLLQDIQNKSQQGYWPYPKALPVEQVDEIMALRLEGVSRENSFQRFYPTMELMARVIGFTGKGQDGSEGRGQGGIEHQFDDWLAGEAKEYRVLQSRGGGIIRVLDTIKPAKAGRHIQLSLDQRIQKIVHDALEEALHEHQAQSASAVVVDIKSGEILAMVSLPTGNPNHEIERTAELLKNPILQDAFEPASTIKPIVAAIALDEKVITLKTQFKTNGIYRIGRREVKDVKNYGTLDIYGVISQSSNIGMALIAERLPREKFYQYMQHLGLGKKVLGFRGESGGTLHNPQGRGAHEYATMTFGYSLATSALQLVQAYATIANDGVKVPLTLLKRESLPAGERVFTAQTAKNVQKMMESVVISGTGKRAGTEHYTAAGKTGTAHRTRTVREKQKNGTWKEVTRYAAKDYNALFAGFAPVQQPRIAVAVVIHSPRGKGHHGGVVAAPTFSTIASQSLKIIGVLPDKLEKVHHFTIDPKEEGL